MYIDKLINSFRYLARMANMQKNKNASTRSSHTQPQNAPIRSRGRNPVNRPSYSGDVQLLPNQESIRSMASMPNVHNYLMPPNQMQRLHYDRRYTSFTNPNYDYQPHSWNNVWDSDSNGTFGMRWFSNRQTETTHHPQTQFDEQENGESGLRQWKFSSMGGQLKRFDNFGRNRGIVFNLMSYNVLAQDLLDKHPHLYKTNHDQEHLAWEYRWNNLQIEIRLHNAEIICMQEVQESHLDEYNTFFNKLGYEGVFKKRTNNDYSDGCAIFYKTDIFTMLEHHTVEYFQKSQRLDRPNIGIIARFAPKASPAHVFVVATTHLLYNPKREDIRLAQTQILLSEIDRIAYVPTKNDYLPVILCGDFNSPPSTEGVFNFLSNGEVLYKQFINKSKNKFKDWITPELAITNQCKHLHLEEKRTNGEDCVPTCLTRKDEEKIIQIQHSDRTGDLVKTSDSDVDEEKLFDSGKLNHNFPFESVYPQNEVSTHQDLWLMVDYIFYSKKTNPKLGALKYLKRYVLPTEKKLKDRKVKGIPNHYVGSDHFALVATFKFEY